MSEPTDSNETLREPTPDSRACPSCRRRQWRRTVELPLASLPSLIDAVARTDVDGVVAIIERGGVALDAMQFAELAYLVCDKCWLDGRFDVLDRDCDQGCDFGGQRSLGTLVLEGPMLRRLVEAAERGRSALLLRRWKYPPTVVDCPKCRERLPVVPIIWGKPAMQDPGARGAIAGGCILSKGAPKVGCVRCGWHR